MSEIIITKTTASGKSVVIAVDATDVNKFMVSLDGVAGGSATPYAETIKTVGNCWTIAWNGKKILLTKAEFETLRNYSYSHSGPAVVTRASLEAKYRALIGDQAAAYERAHDRQDENAYRIKASFEQAIQDAFAAIQNHKGE